MTFAGIRDHHDARKKNVGMTREADTVLMRAMVRARSVLMTAAVRMPWDWSVFGDSAEVVGVLGLDRDRVRLVDRVVTQLPQHRLHYGEYGGEERKNRDEAVKAHPGKLTWFEPTHNRSPKTRVWIRRPEVAALAAEYLDSHRGDSPLFFLADPVHMYIILYALSSCRLHLRGA